MQDIGHSPGTGHPRIGDRFTAGKRNHRRATPGFGGDITGVGSLA